MTNYTAKELREQARIQARLPQGKPMSLAEYNAKLASIANWVRDANGEWVSISWSELAKRQAPRA